MFLRLIIKIRLIKSDKVSARLEWLKYQLAEECLIDSAYIINGFKNIHERCVQAEQVFDSEGNPTGEYRFDSSGANTALDRLAKINGDYEKDNNQKKPEINQTNIDVRSMSDAELEKLALAGQ